MAGEVHGREYIGFPQLTQRTSAAAIAGSAEKKRGRHPESCKRAVRHRNRFSYEAKCVLKPLGGGSSD